MLKYVLLAISNIDKKTYKVIAADIKTCGDPSVETIVAHLSGGVNQAPNLVLDNKGFRFTRTWACNYKDRAFGMVGYFLLDCIDAKRPSC